MESIGRIGLIMPEITDPLDYELLGGVFSQAKELGYDVIVYTGVINSMSSEKRDKYIEGFENIYSLVCKSSLDGIIFAADRFRSELAQKEISNYIAQAGVPALALEYDKGGMPQIISEQHSGAYAMTSHLIEVHGCRKVWCFAGFPDHEPSKMRLQGYLDAMADHGLEVDENSVRYGHYWRDIPEQTARDIAEGRLPCPDGAVCLNDSMAIYFTNELIRNGIAVPEKVKVTGYDGMWYSALHDPIMTTVGGRDRQFGEQAVQRLYEMMTGRTCKPFGSRQTVRIGTSCGCDYNKVAADRSLLGSLEKHVVHQLFRGFEKKSFLRIDFISSMSEAESVKGLMDAADRAGHILPGWKWLDIALCEDWQPDFDNPSAYRQHSFPDRMYLALSKRYGENEQSGYYYPTADIIPALGRPHQPLITVLTSMHCAGQIFGYTAMAYDSPDSIELDDYFVNWNDAICSGLHSLQKRQYVNYVRQQMESLSTTDTMTGLLNRRGFTEKLPDRLSRLRIEGMPHSLLLISWLDAPEAFDPAVLIANAIKAAASGQLCGRLGDFIFGILLTSSDAASIASTLSDELGASLGNPALIPELITDEMVIEGTAPADVEKEVAELCLSFTERRTAELNRNSAYREEMYSLRRSIMTAPELDWNIPDISRELGISKTHLSRLYKELFSTSIKEDIILSRMNRAAQLLSHTDLRVGEIAEQCGYNNENHFMRQFKEKKGMTALQYRRAGNKVSGNEL